MKPPTAQAPKERPLLPDRGEPQRRSDSNNQISIQKRGDVHLKLGEFKDAEQCYRSTLELGPPTPDTLINLGFALKELGRPKEAVDFIDRALKIAPNNPDAHYIRGLLYQAHR